MLHKIASPKLSTLVVNAIQIKAIQARNFAADLVTGRRGDEFAQKAVIMILIVLAGVAAVGTLGGRIVDLLNQSSAGI
jgi:hypothetical protein